MDRAEPRDRDIYGVRLGVESVKLVLPTKRIWRAAVGVAPERGVTGIAAGRRETIGEAGVGWRRRTESWSMMGLLSCARTGYLSLAQLLARSSPRGFQTACSLGYYTVFVTLNDPLERHTARALASRNGLKTNMLCKCQERQGPAHQIKKLGAPA